MSAFDTSKESILQNLDAGVDFSFKGSIDAPIVELVHFLNSLQDYFTTSSCSGRVSVFRSGLTAKQIRWILVKHRLFAKSEVLSAIQCIDPADTDFVDSLVTLKCEAFILHINCRDLESAKSLHNIATLCGFRESGIKLGNKKIILAVRTTANGMELPIARGSELLVSDSYLDLIINECNARLASNFSRIDKFLSELKKHYSWPVLHVLNTVSSSENSLRRWGHTVSANSISNNNKTELSALVLGGYGVAAGSDNDKSQRSLHSTIVCGDKMEQLDFVDDSMHAASAVIKLSHATNSVSLLLVSGGRTSPAVALSCLRLFNTEKSYSPVSFTVSGEEPSPRWGHSLTLVLANPFRCSFLLYGGRDAANVLGDAHLLHIEFTETGMSCSWEKLNLQQESAQVPLERFFHAACASLHVFPVDDSQNKEYNMVVVHGGLLSMDDPITCGKGFIIDPNTGMLTLLTDQTVQASTGNTESQESGEVTKVSNAVPTLKDVRRFGHTLTAVGAKTLLLIGGASFQSSFNDSSIADTLANNETLALDLYIDATGRYGGTFRTVELSGAVQSAILSDPPSLPDQESRVHHQAVYHPASGVLDVIGGGAMTLAFGAHFSPSLRVQVCTNANTPMTAVGANSAMSNRSTSSGGRTNSTSGSEKSFFANFVQTEKIQDCTVIFAPASSVRSVKVYLESLKYLDKTRSIAKVEPTVLSNSFASSAPYRVSLTAPFGTEQLSDADSTELEKTTFATGSWMAIPITSQLEAILKKDADMTILAALQPLFAPQSTFLLGQYSARISKRTQVNSAQKAVEFLQALSSHHRLPVQATGGALASRFEVVGDVLMLPEQYLTGPQWEAILGLETTSDTVGVTTRVAETDSVAQYRRQVFGTLAQCFGLQRVARKAEIDSGPKRESKVRLLHPVLGMPTTTGPGSPGWVTVYENKIGFSFDITRVMFCSGNVTERMRMGRQSSQGDVVVDFYCGIGYYTVPLLVHGGARRVHACEWNPNSVLALRENLRRAGVSDRCTVYEGDNKISAESLHDLADRVNLGLLPSSVTGWELAVRALKPTGGMIHVHENVLESILDTWVEETRQFFETKLKACGKELKVSIVHLERVKSYAPRVYHVVLDLSCVIE